MKRAMTRLIALLAGAFLFLVGRQVTAEEGPVWFWLAACDGPALHLEVQLDGTTLHESVFPICRADRSSPVSQGQRIGKIHFTFTPGRAIVWEGYRDTRDTTKAGQPLDAEIWQAGADTDAILMGVSFSDTRYTYANTIHIAHPAGRDKSELATGLTVMTEPFAAVGEQKQ
jgi:hypothetical protein